MADRPPIDKLPRGLGLRQRLRGDGNWRLWWEPTPAERAAGATAVELDPDRPTWSIRKARQIKADGTAAPRPRNNSNGRTVEALVNEYLRSPRFGQLRPATQADYRQAFGVIVTKWGAQPVSGFSRPVIYAWYETLHRKTPTYAGAMVRKFSVLFTYAELIGWRPENSNPCRSMRLAAAARRDRFATWAEFDALQAAADLLGMTGMGAAIALATLAAQRKADVIAARVGDFAPVHLPDGSALWVWNLTRSKRGNRGSVPLHADLVPILRPWLNGRDKAAPLLLDDQTGAAFTSNTLSNRWDAVRARAACGPSQDDLHAHYAGRIVLPAPALHPMPSLLSPALQFRDLRRTFGVWARDGGAMKEDVGDVLGNAAGSDPGLGQVYMPAQLVTAARAVNAIRRPAAAEKKKA